MSSATTVNSLVNSRDDRHSRRPLPLESPAGARRLHASCELESSKFDKSVLGMNFHNERIKEKQEKETVGTVVGHSGATYWRQKSGKRLQNTWKLSSSARGLQEVW